MRGKKSKKGRNSSLDEFGIKEKETRSPLEARSKRRESYLGRLAEYSEKGLWPQHKELRERLSKIKDKGGKPIFPQKYLDDFIEMKNKRQSPKYLKQKKVEKERKERLDFMNKITQTLRGGKVQKKPLGQGGSLRVIQIKDLYKEEGVVAKLEEPETGSEKAFRPGEEIIQEWYPASVEEGREAIRVHKKYEKAAGEGNVAPFYGGQLIFEKETIRDGERVVFGPRAVFLFKREKPIAPMEFEKLPVKIVDEKGRVRKSEEWVFDKAKMPSAKELKRITPEIMHLNEKLASSGMYVDSKLLNYAYKLGDPKRKIVFIDTLQGSRMKDPFYNSVAGFLNDARMNIEKKDFLELKKIAYVEIKNIIMNTKGPRRNKLKEEFKKLKEEYDPKRRKR